MKHLIATIKAKAKALWVREPVLLGAALPLLVVVGVITSRDASAITQAVTSAAAFVSALVAALKVRAVVDSPATKATKGQGG